jgi:hypothetical protein
MPLDLEQEVAMALAGAVSLPAPWPASGPISIVVTAADRQGEWTIYLRVQHRVHRRLKLTRLIDVRSVRAIMTPDGLDAAQSVAASDELPSSSTDDWVVTPGRLLIQAIQELIGGEEKRRKGKSSGPVEIPLVDHGIIFCAESAPVLMEVEVGMTAAESADYYPPLCNGSHPKCG